MKLGRIEVDSFDMRTAIQKITDLISKRNGGAVFTPNVDHIVLANENSRFAEAYDKASLKLADGMPLVWASRILGPRIPERVAGSDLLPPLLDLACDNKWSVYFLGSSEEILNLAALKAEEKYAEIDIIGTSSPFLSPEVSDEEVKEIMKPIMKMNVWARPHIIIVAFGAPKQEIFISKARKIYSKGVFFGLGASLDFFAGKLSRSPLWMQKVGLEWLFRLSQDPKRLFKRYVRDIQFPIIVIKEMLK